MSTSFEPQHEVRRSRWGLRGRRHDVDRDGVPDQMEPGRRDVDRDGVPDRMEPGHRGDRDRDGVPDQMERAHRDVDRDGVPDRMEPGHRGDRDRDGVPDRMEPGHRGDRTDTMDTVETRQPVTAPTATAADLGLDRRAVIARERAEFGGIKIGSAFFGWLAATGMAVLLTALAAGIGVAVGLGTGTDAREATDQAVNNPEAVSVAGAVLLMVILFLSYYCGGYVAGRMARFNGAKQGLAVWLWALLAAIVVAVLAAVGGDRFEVLDRLDGFPRLPVNEGELPAAIITGLFLAAASLVGAILGGLAGMRFHRRVDRAGLEPTPVHRDEHVA